MLTRLANPWGSNRPRVGWEQVTRRPRVLSLGITLKLVRSNLELMELSLQERKTSLSPLVPSPGKEDQEQSSGVWVVRVMCVLGCAHVWGNAALDFSTYLVCHSGAANDGNAAM